MPTPIVALSAALQLDLVGSLLVAGLRVEVSPAGEAAPDLLLDLTGVAELDDEEVLWLRQRRITEGRLQGVSTLALKMDGGIVVGIAAGPDARGRVA